MPDPRPLPGREPGEATSGTDLRLTMRGLVERMESGEKLVENIAAKLLMQLQDAPRPCVACDSSGVRGDATCNVCGGVGTLPQMADKSPVELARLRAQLIRLTQDDEHHIDKTRQTDERIAIERQKLAPDEDVGDLFIVPPEWAGEEEEETCDSPDEDDSPSRPQEDTTTSPRDDKPDAREDSGSR